jgi:hypothetical protein
MTTAATIFRLKSWKMKACCGGARGKVHERRSGLCLADSPFRQSEARCGADGPIATSARRYTLFSVCFQPLRCFFLRIGPLQCVDCSSVVQKPWINLGCYWVNLGWHWANLGWHWANLGWHWANLGWHWPNLGWHWANLGCHWVHLGWHCVNLG